VISDTLRLLRWCAYYSLLVICYNIQMRAQSCPEEVISGNRAATVFIKVKKTLKVTGQVEERTGTGFIISASGYVLTSRHVVEADERVDEIEVAGSIGSRKAASSELAVIARNEHDVALLKFADTSKTYSSVVLGKPSDVKVGTTLCAVGFPKQQEFYFASGTMSGEQGALWVTQMPSNPGDSGAPVFLSSGEVVAIKFGGYDDAQNINLLVPMNLAGDLLTKVPDLPDLSISHGSSETIVRGRIVPPQKGKQAKIRVDGEASEAVADEYGGFEIKVHKKSTERARFSVWVDGKQVCDQLQSLSGEVALFLRQ
jgi:S1-C subfamily serine protease